MRSLATVLAAEFDEDWYRRDLASIVGERTDDELAAWIASLCRRELKQDVVGARFANKSVGAVFGLALANAENVVLKVFPSSLDRKALLAIERCLSHVHAAGFPSPKQLVPLFEAGSTFAAFYELVEGEVLDAHRPDVRRTLAEALASLTEIVANLDPAALPVALGRDETLWDAPHRAEMRLDIEGGEWIDERARACRQVIRDANLSPICAHYDWSTKNTLFRDGRLRAVLDWDSMKQASEAEMVGRAAAEFTAHGGGLTSRSTPTHDEATAFVREYEDARGRRFSDIERHVVRASAEYLIAQVSRHGFSGPDCADDEYRGLLRTLADAPLIVSS
jgi:hypothetical protein